MARGCREDVSAHSVRPISWTVLTMITRTEGFNHRFCGSVTVRFRSLNSDWVAGR